MINPAELRLGNLIQAVVEKTVYTVDGVDIMLFESMAKDRAVFEPLPLTVEWVLKFEGFGYYEGGLIGLQLNERYWLDLSPKAGLIKSIRLKLDVSNGFYTSECVLPAPKYVHQLQNIYYMLTLLVNGEGSELKLRE